MHLFAKCALNLAKKWPLLNFAILGVFAYVYQLVFFPNRYLLSGLLDNFLHKKHEKMGSILRRRKKSPISRRALKTTSNYQGVLLICALKMGVQKEHLFDHFGMIKTPFLNVKWGHYLVMKSRWEYPAYSSISNILLFSLCLYGPVC